MWSRFRQSRTRPVANAPADAARLAEAFEQGRREGAREERRRHRHPVRNLLVGVTALAGVGILATAAWYGSFGRGGEVVDARLAVAADRAEPTVGAAVDEAGAALREAGRDLQNETDDSGLDTTPRDEL